MLLQTHKMNTTDRNTKANMIVEYTDIFENNDKGKDAEKNENETKMNTKDGNTKAKMKEHVAKHESYAISCYKCNFETKTLGKLTDHMAKHRSQEWF